MKTTSIIPEDYKPTKYTFRGMPVYKHDGLYVLVTGQFVMHRDLVKSK